MKRLLLISLLLAMVDLASAYEPLKRKVYMFGVAASFTDSVAYITDVQPVDEAHVHYNGFLADRTLYAAQLNVFMQTSMKRENMTCVVFFNKSKSKLEKKYLKVKKKFIAGQGIPLTPLGRDVFQFKAEEWVEPTLTETPAETAVADFGKTKKRGKK